MALPEALYCAEQTRELDRLAMTAHAIPGATLMARAGAAAFALLRLRWPRARRIALVCGPGNNGGDGYVLARLARGAGLTPVVTAVGDPARLPVDAREAYEACRAIGLAVHPVEAGAVTGADVVVDALFGTGLTREVSGPARAAIAAMNASGAPVLAVDVPSGLQADTGRVLGAAVRAQITISFIGLKLGLFTGAGRELAGEIVFDGLQLPEALYEAVPPPARRITPENARGVLGRRPRDAHKGRAGHVLVVGGAAGMPGAVRLAGEAAYRAGAGLVSLATHPAHAALLPLSCPELMVHGVEAPRDLRAAATRAHVIALGPGLGQGAWGRALFAAALAAPQPKVVDADALNLLAAEPQRRRDWILTPHPGEAARLLGCDAQAVQADRAAAARELAARYGGVCLLKGSGTLVATEGGDTLWLCDRGNPGMASGGMGDVLTGVVAGLLAQGLAPLEAARLGAWVHGAAGDDVAAAGETGLLASDLLGYLRIRINELCC